MFLDVFETDCGVWLQACVSFPFLGEAVPGSCDALGSILDARAVVPALSMAFRVALTSSGELQRTLILLAPKSSEPQLRRFIALFSRLELTSPGSIAFAQNSEALDSEFLGNFPSEQCRAVPSGFGSAQAWFAADFRLAFFLDQLLIEARSLGLAIAYQMHARQIETNTEVLRSAKHNLANLGYLAGLPQKALLLQQTLAERLTSASYQVEEFVGVDPPNAQTWLLPALDSLFASKHSALGFGLAGFCLGDFRQLLGAGLHSSFWNRCTPDEHVTMAADVNELKRVLGWHPNRVLSQELRVAARPPAERAEAPAIFSEVPAPYLGSESYIFVSYRHSDLPVIAPFLRDLSNARLRFWYDHGIPGSSEWMHVLEQRIENADLILVFLSQSAVESKYVRREILMADTLNKPILTLKIGNPELRWGLKLVLPQYQMEEAGAQPVPVSVRQALRYAAANRNA